MSFLHISLAALGSSLVAVPILLHLLMRPRPRHYVFPALRFVQARKNVNQRQLKLRHLILLMLRCLAIIALALALARPFVPSAQTANVVLLSLLGISALASLALALVTYTTDRERPLAAGFAALGILLAGIAIFMGVRYGTANRPVSLATMKRQSRRQLFLTCHPAWTTDTITQTAWTPQKSLANGCCANWRQIARSR